MSTNEAGPPMGEEPGENGQRIYEQGRRVGSEAKALADDVGTLMDEVEGFLGRQMEDRPYVTLAAAAGAGYVLGGGIPAWVVRLGIAVGGRVLVGALLREVIAGSGDLSNLPGMD